MPQQICFPNHEGQPFDPSAPTVDGYVEPEPGMAWVFGSQPAKVDVGWTGAGRQTFGDATEVDIATPLAVLQGVRHASQPKLFLSFIVRRDVSFDHLDRIVLVLHPDFAAGSATKTGDERRIDIRPVSSGEGAGSAAPNDPDPWGITVSSEGFKTNRPPLNIETYRWSTAGTGSWQAMSIPTGLNVRVRSWDSGTNNRNWSLEVEVPTTIAAGGADWIDMTTSIGFFADMIRVTQGTPLGLDFVTQFVWPRGAELDDQGGILNLNEIPIEPSKLGQAFVGSSALCANVRGVRFEGTWGSVGARAPGSTVPPGSAIVATQNEFVARLANDGPTADGVRADFRIANWGIGPGDSPLWNRLNADVGHNNPTPGQTFAAGTPASPTSAELTTRWTPPAGQYGTTLYPHQCIWVLLDSSSDVSFVRASTKRNMDVVGLSHSDTEAEINGEGWADEDDGPGDLEFLLLESHLTLTRQADIVIEGERPLTHLDPRTVLRPKEREGPREPEKPEGGSSSWYEQAFVTIIDGYRRTQRTLTVEGQRLPIYSYTDSFGQIGVHSTGKPDDVGVELDGPTLRRTGPGGYLVQVPQDGAVKLNVRMRTVERPDRPPRPDENWLVRLLRLLLELVRRLFRRDDGTGS